MLPFSVPLCEEDFLQSASRAELQALLARASSCRALPGEKNEQSATIRAYEAAGHAVLDDSDLLIGVWDGAPARSLAGTGSLVLQALKRRMPVLRFDQNGDGPQYWDDHPAPTDGAATPEALRSGLLRRLARLGE